MTISNPSNVRRYVGPGNAFAYDRPVFSEDGSDIVVTLESPPGVLSTPVLNGVGTYDYAVTGTYDPAAFRYPAGVTITLNNALPSGWTIAIENIPSPVQLSDYQEGGPLPAERLETDLDRLTVLAQIPLNAAARTLLAPPTDPAGDLILPPVAQRASKVFTFDANGLPLAQDIVAPGGVVLSDNTPANLGVAAPGTSSEVSRSDHVHSLAALGLGTAAGADLGTGPTDVPTNGDLGSAAYLDVGTAIGDVVQLEDDGGGNPALPAVSGANLLDLPPSKVIQMVSTQTGAVGTTTTIMPYDDTIPQNTEGAEFMTLAITPTKTTNKLKIEVVAFVTQSASDAIGTAPGVALFQDSTANALAAGNANNNAGNLASMPVVFTHVMDAGTVNSTTFKVRAGPHVAGTLTFNGRNSGRIYGGVMASSICITEYIP